MTNRLFAATLALSLAPAADGRESQRQPQEQTSAETASGPHLPPPTPISAAPAPMRIQRGANLFIEPSEFGMALSAAILKKKVPVVVVLDPVKSDFAIHVLSKWAEDTGFAAAYMRREASRLGLANPDILRFEAIVTILNRDRTIVFAHSPKKHTIQSAAENVAKALKQHIEGR